MRRREFLRTGSVLLFVVSGGTIAARALDGDAATVQQVVREGVPQPTSVLSVPLTRAVSVVDSEGIAASVPVADPVSGSLVRQSVPVSSATASGRMLRLVLEGPASRGTVVSFDRGSLAVGGEPSSAFALRLDDVDARPERATQWFKSYVPMDVDRFDDSVYRDATPGVPMDDGTAVRTRLSRLFGRFVDRGDLDEARADALMTRFDDPAVRARFRTGEGAFAPELLAGLLATAGTVARSLERVVLDGDNVLGEPYTVTRQPTPSGGLMEVRIYDGTPAILVDPRLRGEPLAVLAALFAHEGLHQDLSVGLHEEVIATYLETLVWAEHLLSDPALARRGTNGVKRANRNLLVALNSGRLGFPEVGLRRAPRQGSETSATPGADDPISDFVSIVETYYRGTAPVTSPGVPYARRVLTRVTGRPVGYVAFDGDAVDRLDRETRLFSTDDVLSLLGTLRLRPAVASSAEGEPNERRETDASAEVNSSENERAENASEQPQRGEVGDSAHPNACGAWLSADGQSE